MNKTSNDSTTVSLHQTFWRWLSFSVLALMIAAAIPALSADVFIDEGDGDFAPTPVTSPAPASVTEAPPANPGADIDSAIGSLQQADEGLPVMVDAAPVVEAAPIETLPMDTTLAAPVAVKEAKKESKKAKSDAKSSKKKHLQVVKSSKSKKEKKSEKKTASKSKAGKDKKADKKTAAAKAKKSKKKSLGSSSKASKRSVASVHYAGGKYATTSRACPMESSPGSGDAIGMTVSGRNLWVEESGNTSYWKVYGKSGAAAFVSRDCF